MTTTLTSDEHEPETFWTTLSDSELRIVEYAMRLTRDREVDHE